MHPHLPSSTSRIYCSGHLYVTIHACVLNTYIDLTFTSHWFLLRQSCQWLFIITLYVFYYFLVVNRVTFNDKGKKKRCKISLLILQQIFDGCHKMREIISSRTIDYVRGIKSRMMLFRENSTFLRSLGSPAQVVVRFEGSQARQNGYLVFRRSNPELFPLSSARRARMPTIFRSLEPLFTAFVSKTSKYWRSLLKRRVRFDYIVASTRGSFVINQKGDKCYCFTVVSWVRKNENVNESNLMQNLCPTIIISREICLS